MLQAVCATAYLRETNDGRVDMGCRSCELRPSSAPPVAVRSTWKDMPRRVIDVRFGGFTRKGADEAVLTFVGCERTVESIGTITRMGQGLVLVERRNHRWELRRYVPELGYCGPIKRRDGREALLCVASGMDGRHTIDLVDFNAPELPTRVLNMTTRPLAEEMCEHPHHTELAFLADAHGGPVDLDGDGVDDIKFEAKLRPISAESIRAQRARPDFALACACHRVLPMSARIYPGSNGVRIKAGCDCPVLGNTIDKMGPPQDLELRFLEKEGRFEPTPETKAALEGLRRWHLWPPSVLGDNDD
jgi:hypothetical protein